MNAYRIFVEELLGREFNSPLTPMTPAEIEKSRKLIIRQKNKSGEVTFFN